MNKFNVNEFQNDTLEKPNNISTLVLFILGQGYKYGAISEDRNPYSLVIVNKNSSLTSTPHQGTIFLRVVEANLNSNQRKNILAFNEQQKRKLLSFSLNGCLESFNIRHLSVYVKI